MCSRLVDLPGVAEIKSVNESQTNLIVHDASLARYHFRAVRRAYVGCRQKRPHFFTHVVRYDIERRKRMRLVTSSYQQKKLT